MITVGILAGGLGTRISEETHDKPKPMVMINGQPILKLLIDSLAAQGVKKFIIATGYKGEIIKTWVNASEYSQNVVAIDTGEDSLTGIRVKMLLEFADEDIMLVTYGDGLANIQIPKLKEFHLNHGKMATVTAVHPPARFGHLSLEGDSVTRFNEKNQSDEGWISGGFFILKKQVASYIDDPALPFELGALPKLAQEGNLRAFKHYGFWKPMDTLRDKIELEQLAREETPPWMK